MKALKKVSFWPTSSSQEVDSEDFSRVPTVSIILLEDLDYPIATWPCSLFLSAFICQRPEIFRGKRILELGAGTSLPSLLCAHPAIGALHVISSERDHEPELMSLIAQVIHINQVDHTCVAMPLDWNQPVLPSMIVNHAVDLILGADVFYCDDDFPLLFRLLHKLFLLNPQACFYTTYQIRSEKRTLWPWLEKYSLIAVEIPRAEFLSTYHNNGFCEVQRMAASSNSSDTKSTSDDSDVSLCPITTFDDLQLVLIRPKNEELAKENTYIGTTFVSI